MVTEDKTGIEAHVRRLWRHRGTSVPTPRRGPRQQLDLDEIVQAGIDLADADGLGAVSTRAVAAQFGKSAMALYPYVGSKESLIALMEDHACAMPSWTDPATGLAAALEAWARARYEVYLAHPWLTELPWSQSAQGPNAQDWLERLLGILDRWDTPGEARASAVTMLYATVRATAQTEAFYRRMDEADAAAWWERATVTAELLPDLPRRYPQSAGLIQHAPSWRGAPDAALTNTAALLAQGLGHAAPK
jgi:AcrR family transcriptional regulator